jgi:hypothetical protein
MSWEILEKSPGRVLQRVDLDHRVVSSTTKIEIDELGNADICIDELRLRKE